VSFINFSHPFRDNKVVPLARIVKTTKMVSTYHTLFIKYQILFYFQVLTSSRVTYRSFLKKKKLIMTCWTLYIFIYRPLCPGGFCRE